MSHLHIGYIDGARFKEAFIAGGTWVIHNRDRLNRINVFPVADKDTGTNLQITFLRTIQKIRDVEERSLGEMVKAIARELIVEARGNSGVIFSQFFSSLAAALEQHRKIHAPEFVEALKHAIHRTYEGLENPKEGTILTVIRESVEQTIQQHAHERDVFYLLKRLHEHAQRTLEKTKEMLPQLRKAQVVDAGGMAYVLFLQGVLKLLREGRHVVETLLEKIHDVQETEEVFFDETPNFRFCTEAVLRTYSKKINRQRIMEALRSFGDSLVVVGQEDTYHIHIHTDTPNQVYQALGVFGEIVRKKVQDMIAQSQGIQKKAVTVAMDSTCDLPVRLREDLGILIVPQQIVLKDRILKDRIDIQPEEVLSRLVRGEEVKTSQATPEDIRRVYEKALEKADHVLMLVVSSKLSGTYLNCMNVAQLFEGRVTVFDTLSISLGITLQALEALDLAEQGLPPEEIVEILKKKRDRALLYFYLPTLKYLMQGGRIGRVQGRIGMFLKLRLLMALEEGAIVKKETAFSEGRIIQKLKKRLLQEIPKDQPYDFAVAWNTDGHVLKELEPFIRENFTVRRFLTGTITPVISVHTGPHAWGVFASPVVSPR